MFIFSKVGDLTLRVSDIGLQCGWNSAASFTSLFVEMLDEGHLGVQKTQNESSIMANYSKG
jgi:hypothetical protein